MPQSQLSTILFTTSAIFQIAGTLIADFFSASHIYNEAWPAHAKFHTGQTISFAITLALLGLYFVFRPNPEVREGSKGSEGLGSSISNNTNKRRLAGKAGDITTAMVVLNLYWITQFMAFFYPGTHWCDPPFCHGGWLPPQLGVEAFGVGLNCFAWWTERKAIQQGIASLDGKDERTVRKDL